MNLQSEQRLSQEELRMRNSKDLMIARDTERLVTLSEKNWEAVIRLLESILNAQNASQQFQKTLLTATDVEQYLMNLSQQNKLQQEQFRKTAKQFEIQVGNTSEQFSSASQDLTANSKAGLDLMTRKTQQQITDITNMAQREISNLVESAQRKMMKASLLSAAATALLAISSVLAVLLS